MRYLVIVIVIVIAIVSFIGFRSISKHTVKIRTDKKLYKIFVEIADDSDERALGLMGRKELPDGEGMLFVYDREGYPSFWMKNMKVPIDIIFIGSDFKIRQIEQDVQPCTEDMLDCPRLTASFSVQYVLEVNSGYTKRRQIKVGNPVTLKL